MAEPVFMKLKRHNQTSQIANWVKRKLWHCLWVGLLSLYLAAPAPLQAQGPMVELEIRYTMPDAGMVTLVWGINGWQPVPEAIRPAGTTLSDTKMLTPMSPEGDVFVVKLQVPAKAQVDYGFWILQNRAGEPVDGWEAPEQAFQANQEGIIELQTGLSLSGDKVVLRVEPEAMVPQELRYYAPRDAVEVTLVWDVEGWVLPEAVWPDGTLIQEGQMYTPMQFQEDYFTAVLQIPTRKRINYRFWISHKGESSPNQSWDNHGGQGYTTSDALGELVEVKASRSSDQVIDKLLDTGLYLGFGLLGISLLSLGLYLLPLRHPLEVGLLLLGLVVIGLMVRLWLIWGMAAPAPLSANETLYLNWAGAIRQGQWPEVRTLYPLFLALCSGLPGNAQASIFYVQAVLGAALILLTFGLARSFTSPRLSLWAATLVALHPGLVFQVHRLSDETLYTLLLALAVLSLLWALQNPETWRFGLAGGLLGVTLLARPTLLFFPLLLPLLLPRFWNPARRWHLCLAYAGVVGIFILLAGLYRLPAGLDGMVLWEGSPEFNRLLEEQKSLQAVREAYLEEEQDPLTVAGNSYWGNRALNSIVAEPGSYGSYFLLKLLFFWMGHPIFDWSQFDLETLLDDLPAPSLAMLLASRLLPLAAVLALIILHMGHQQGQLLRPLLIICGYFMIIHSLTNAGLFASEPLYPLLIVMIATAIKPAEIYSSPYSIAFRRWSYT